MGQRMFINRDFGLLFWGRLVSQVGDGAHYLALTWLVLDLTGSGTALGTMIFAASIPALLLSPFTGVLADLWDRKTIVVSMDVIRGLVILSLAVLFRAGRLNLAVLYGATIASSLCGVLFGPAISATIPGLVKKDELVKANALNNMSRAATMIIGPVLGAFLLDRTGYSGIFTINGIAFLLSAISEMFIRFPKVNLDGQTSGQVNVDHQVLAGLREGFNYVWEDVGLKTLIIFALAINFLGAPIFSVILPYFVKEVLEFNAQQFSIVQVGLPVGFLVGTALIGWLTKKYRKDILLCLGIGGQGLVGVLFGLISLPIVFGTIGTTLVLLFLVIAIFIIGFFNTLVNVPFEVMIQETVPDRYRGRVYGLLDSMMQLLTPVSTAFSGVLVDSFSVASIFIGVGILIIILGVNMASSHPIRQLYEQTQAGSK